MRLSTGETKFIRDGIVAGVRADGRGLLDLRHVTVELGTVPSANGSATLKSSFAKTQIVCGVKVEIGPCDPDNPNEGILEASVDCSALSGGGGGGSSSSGVGGAGSSVSSGGVKATTNLSEREADDLGMNLAEQVLEILHASSTEKDASLNLESLCLIPGKFCWHVYIDVIVLGAEGSLLDSISMAIFCALNDAKRPMVTIVDTEYGQDFEINSDIRSAEPLGCNGVPLIVTFSLINGQLVTDATSAEEACAESILFVAVNSRGNITFMGKQGNGMFASADVRKVVAAAQSGAMKMFRAIDVS